jgi:hypothetical protein
VLKKDLEMSLNLKETGNWRNFTNFAKKISQTSSLLSFFFPFFLYLLTSSE